MKKVYFDNADYETFKGMKIQDIDWSNIDHQYNENIPQNKKRDDQSLDSQNWNKKIDMMQFRTKDFEAFKGSINDAEIYEDNQYLCGYVSSNVVTFLRISPDASQGGKKNQLEMYAKIEINNKEAVNILDNEKQTELDEEKNEKEFANQLIYGPQINEAQKNALMELEQENFVRICFGKFHVEKIGYKWIDQNMRHAFDQKDPRSVQTYCAVGAESGLIHILLILKNGYIKYYDQLEGHVNAVKSIKHYKNDYLLSGSEDGLIILWNVVKKVQVCGWVPTYKTPSSIFFVDLHPSLEYFAGQTMEGDIKIVKITNEIIEKMKDSETQDDKFVSNKMKKDREIQKRNLKDFSELNKPEEYQQGWRRLDLMEHFYIIQNTLQSHCDSLIFRNNFIIVKSVYGRIKIYTQNLQEESVLELADFNTPLQ